MDNDTISGILENCEYIYSDGTRCSQPVSKDFKDSNNKKYCIYHSHNDEKLNDFSKLIQEEIWKKHKTVTSNHDSIVKSGLSQEQKKEEYEKLKAINLINFKGYYFPEKYKFERLKGDNGKAIISSNITFKNAFFFDAINFSDFQFNGHVDFTDAVFEKEADFSNSHFYGEIITLKSIYRGEVHFDEAIFQNGKPDFSEIEFPDQASFSKTRFDKGANFSQTKFKGYANFQSAQFGKDMKKETEFNTSIFYKEANFTKTIFNGPVDFNNTKFINITSNDDEISFSFLDTQFKQTAGFNNVVFKGNASFINVRFEQSAEFNNTQFLNNAYFQSAKFSGNGLEAKRSIFYGKTNFSNSEFVLEANFGEVSFLGKQVNFKDLKCKDQILRNCTFLSDIDFGPYFSSSPFQYFEGVNFIGRADFTNKKLDEYRFLNCLMIGCSFLRSDIVNTIFINCSWDFSKAEEIIEERKKYFKKGRGSSEPPKIFKDIQKKYKKYLKTANKANANTIDEVMFWNENNVEVGEIQECCMQLKNNRDRAKDYLTANKFYHSEMEMIRKREEIKIKECIPRFLSKMGVIKDGKVHFPNTLGLITVFLLLLFIVFAFFYTKTCVILGIIFISFLLIFKMGRYLFFTVYKILSGYGNKPLSAVIWFLVVIILSSILFLAFGAVKKNELIDTRKPIFQINLNGKNEELFTVSITKSVEKGTEVRNQRKNESIVKSSIEKLYYLFMWNLTNPFTAQNKQYQIYGILTHFFIFLIQYIFRPLMIALIILAVRRKVKR